MSDEKEYRVITLPWPVDSGGVNYRSSELAGSAYVLIEESEHAAAQSELAALREELATVNNAYRIVLETCGKAVDKMTATEQRNAELEKEISEMKDRHQNEIWESWGDDN